MQTVRFLMMGLLITGAHLVQAQDMPSAKQLLEQGETEQAVAAYTLQIQNHPNDPDEWLGRGLAHARQGQWEAAATDLEQAVSLAPGYADAWSALANVYRWTDKPAAAANAYARLAVLQPNDAQVRVLQARSLLALGDVAGAQAAIERARALGAREDDMPALPAEKKTSAEHHPEAFNEAAAVDGYRWAVSGGISHTSASYASGTENSLSVRHYADWGSIALERLGVHRFGDGDAAWAIDAYPRLWSGAYANLRYQYAASPELYPPRSWRAELYQSISHGWELAASHDFLGFGSGVRIDGVAAGKYWGNFFARWRHQQVKSDSSAGSGDRVLVRYYYTGDADHYVEGNLSSGRSEDYSTNTWTQPSRSGSHGVVWYHFVTRDWGFKLSASQSHDSSAASGRSHDVGLSLTRRW